jgi:plastocyanin
MWSAAALIVLFIGTFAVLTGPSVRAADTTVKMVDGSGDPNTTWKFEPATITISAGSSVVWHNDGQQAHTATGDGFDTGYVSGGKDSKPVSFPTAGRFDYICTPHPWMKAAVVVTGGSGATPTTVAPTTTTTTAGGASTTTAPGATTTTTAKAAGASSTTSTTAAAGGGATTTTLAPALTPTSAPDGASTASTATQAGSEEAAADHSGEGTHKEKKEGKNSPIGIAFALVSTLLLVGIAGKLLASKP